MANIVPYSRRRQETFDKALPHYLPAEKTILGVLILNNEKFAEVPDLRVDDFFLPEHRVIFAAMLELREDRAPVDGVTLTERLYTARKLDAAGGPGYVAQLAEGVPPAMNIAHYAVMLREKALRRQAIYEAEAIQQRALDGSHELQDIAADLASAAERIDPPARGAIATCILTDFLAKEKKPREHLVDCLIPRGGSAMIFAKPHHMKSIFTLGLALGATTPCDLLGRFEVKKPVRTLLVTVEDPEPEVDSRIRGLLQSRTFADVDPKAVDIWGRDTAAPNLMDDASVDDLIRRAEKHKADLVVLDVLRMVTTGDINSPQESGAMCKRIDRVRDRTGAAVVLVHHENRKAEDIMGASAGSFNWPGWANSCIRFTRKQQEGNLSSVEIEVDNKFARPFEPCRLIYEPSNPFSLRIESLEETMGLAELRGALAMEWTVRDLAEALDVHKSSAQRRLKKLITAGIVEKVSGGKRGRQGGLARFQFTQDTSTSE